MSPAVTSFCKSTKALARRLPDGMWKSGRIGAIAGDAGAGAAAGAVGGTLFGGMDRVAPDTPMGDAASGAAKGALIGAIAGDAGKGAAAGAVGGLLMGGIRRGR